ncbi:MAG: hypothetical protein JWN96_597 [Mycobacterium sp.]|jgi:hypothetical protein|nr:hypothetical protein [Mycobacterium sp.]
MHAVLVNMTTDPHRAEEVARHLREDITAWAKQQTGFVHGEWLLSEDRGAGLGLVLFDSAETAARAAEGPRHYSNDSESAWKISGVTLFEHVASADV